MNLNKFYVVGIDHKKLNISERENFIKKNPEMILVELLEENKIEGYVTLSTCLRVEFYFYGEIEKNLILDRFSGQEGLFLLEGEESLDYLFRVVCGFESVIKGEDQILAQMKKSYQISYDKDNTNTALNVIFNRAIEIGKKFRTVSKINHNALSLEAISLKFIKNHVDDLKNKKVFILGTGDLSLGILYLLKKEGVKDITITNRSSHKAYEIQKIHDVGVVSFADKNPVAADNDVIISATSAPHYILKYEEIYKYINRGDKKVFLDLAVPRDIEKTVGDIEGISLYNLDDVWKVYEENISNRSDRLKEYSYLLEDQKKVIRKWFYYKNKIML